MQTTWRCLNCGTPVTEKGESCPLCKETVEDQYHSGPDLYAIALGRDLGAIQEDDEYRRSKNRNRRKTK